MSTKKNTPSQSENTAQTENVSSAQQQMTALQLASLRDVQSLLTTRIADLTAAGSDGKAPPELASRIQRYRTLASALGDASEESERLPKPDPSSFILHGRVRDAAGNPRMDLNVSLSDPKGVLNKRESTVKTDKGGYFTITVRSVEFPELQPGSSQIFVSVTDADQREVARPSQPVVFQPGKVGVMSIVT